MNIIVTLIAVILFFVILIVPHEFGHFITARMLGVKVNEFAFGMGPALFKKQGPETLYSVRAFPIGGYCQLEGENEDTGDPRAFNSKPWWKKIIILAAGVTMNVITALFIMAVLYAVVTHDPVKAIGYSFQAVGRMFTLLFEGLSSLFGGFSLNDVSGPVGIVSAVNETASEGVTAFFAFTSIMCINLAIINILPLPALDGGRILFVIIRGVTGKMISDELEARIHGAGMLLLLGFILIVTMNDIMRSMG